MRMTALRKEFCVFLKYEKIKSDDKNVDYLKYPIDNERKAWYFIENLI